MELLPILIIVSLLGFFITLTTILFTWQYLKARERRKRRRSTGSNHRPTRQLTLRRGQVIPKSEAQDTASTRDPVSIDVPSPGFPEGPTYAVTCEADGRRGSYLRPTISAYDHGSPSTLTDLEAQYKGGDRSEKVSGEPPRRKEHLVVAKTSAQSVQPSMVIDRKGSLTVPRPALVMIESRRPSASKSVDSKRSRSSGSKGKESQIRRSSREISKSLQRAFKRPGEKTPELPASPVTWKMSTQAAESRRTSDNRQSAQTFESATASSLANSESVPRPPPLFSGVNYGQHVRFAQTEDLNRVSFLSTSDSPSSSTTSIPISPRSPTRAPHTSKVDLVRYQPSSPGILSPATLPSPPPLRDTPPHLDTPEFGETSFFDSATSSDEPPNPLNRVISVMSNRSALTIASSEISSNWTIGNAQVVNIYPSVAQARSPPPYARTLKSKYGRYPRGRRDKALPVIPKSPLSQSEFGPL